MTITWQDAAEVGLVMLGGQQARDAVARCADRLPALADAIVENKVAGPARIRLADGGSAAAETLVALIDERRAAADQRMQTIPGIVEVIAYGGRTIGAQWALMKGCSIRERYDDKRLREVGDVDVWVPSARDAWRLSEFLLPLGYVYAPWELPWFKGLPGGDGRLYGQVRLVRWERDRAAVDFHFGPYSVRHCGTMSIGLHADRLLAPEDDIAAIIGNAAGDCRLDLKTVNDLSVLLPLASDVARVHALLDEGGLLPFLRGCISRIRALDSLPASLRALLDRLEPPPGAAEDVQVFARDADRLRIAQTVTHAVDIALRDHSGNVREIVSSAADAYSYEHELTVAAVPGLRIGRPVNWECVRLIPCEGDAGGLLRQTTAREIEDPIRVLGLDQGDLVAVGDRVFVPTVGFRVSEELVGVLAAHGLSLPDRA